MIPNKDFLAGNHNTDLNWHFDVASSATSIEAYNDRLFDLLETVLDDLRPFVRYHKCDVRELLYDEGFNPQNITGRKISNRGSETTTVCSDDSAHPTDGAGLTAEDIRNGISDLLSKPGALIYDLEFQNAELYVILDDYEGYITRFDTDRYRMKEQELPTEGPLRFEPLSLDVSTSYGRLDDELDYTFRLRTRCDIYMQNTDLGAANRERLAELIGRLHRHLPNDGRAFVDAECIYSEQMALEVPFLRPVCPWVEPE